MSADIDGQVLMSLSSHARGPRPIGAVTILFTDIEGSTRLWEHDAARMSQALAAHDAIARRVVEARHGKVVKMLGDGMHAVFAETLDALVASIDFQRALSDPATTGGLQLRVRCGLHAGVVEQRDDDYYGSPVNRAARIMSAAHGGQVLVSQAAIDDVRDAIPPPVSLRDLGKVRLKDLATPEHVYQVLHPELRQDFPALRSLEATPNNLPQQATSFIGRMHELGELERLLAKTRLLTLTGSGGCGKTRLGLQLAADALEQYPDGAWLVEFAALSDAALVAQTVATVLGLKEEAGKPLEQTLTDHLSDKRLLLLFDNCEHLLDAAATLVASVLRRCPDVRILTTSREALGIGGEQTYRVPSLTLPDLKGPHTAASAESFEAVRLFVDRAALARSAFRLSDENAATVVSICLRLDGIPLALELAAARVRSLSVAEIDDKLNERFRLLAGGSRTTLPRQQTLRSLIDWSYDLLNDPAKRLLQRLSVFAGGWTLEAAERVCAGDGMEEGDILDLLTSLVDKSLAISDAVDGDTRFRLVETVRQYAREKLLEWVGSEGVRDRHLDCYVAFAEAAQATLQGQEQALWLRRLEDEHDNLRIALEWSLSTRPEKGLQLCGALQRFWIMRGHHSEGRQSCARALSLAATAPPTPARAAALNCAGLLAYHQLDFAAARAQLEESLAIWRALSDSRGIGIALNNLGMVALAQGDLASAHAMHEQSLALARELGNRNGAARSLGNLGMVASARRDFDSARSLFQACLDLMHELGDRDGIAIALHSLGDVAYEQGDYDLAGSYLADSLRILRELGHRVRIAYSLAQLADVVAIIGDAAVAATLSGAAEQLLEEMGAPRPADPTYGVRLNAVRAALGDDDAFERARQQGRALTLEQAIDLALVHRGRSRADRREG